MATDRASAVPTETGSLAMDASWLAARLGPWVLAAPIVLTGAVASGIPMWSNVVAGLGVVVLAAFRAYAIRADVDEADAWGEWTG
jgi:hypothetical protein